MPASRRAFLTGSAALSAAVLTPETVRALAPLQVAAAGSQASVDIEGDLAPRSLRRIHGRPPAGLEGTLFRNGPGKFRRPGGRATHWFDGDGLMRAFRIRDGQATLEARFADTPKRRLESQLDAVVTPGFGTAGDARARVGSNDDASAANTAVMAAGGEVWALWEGGSPLAMDAGDLSTRGFVTLRDDLKGMPFQAHPRFDPDGTIWNIGLWGDRMVVWRLNPDRSLHTAEIVELPRASYMHDFTATARHLVVVLQPWVFERRAMPYAAQFAWKPELGTRVLVLDKADLTRARTFELPTFSFFHLGDAWEDPGGTIRFDVAAGPDVDFAVEGARVLVEGRGTVPGEPARLALVTLHADGRAALTSSGVVAEFPKSDPRRSGLRRRLTSHTTGESGGRPLPSGVAVHDWEPGRSDAFDFGERSIMEEAVWIPRPGRTGEAEAWLVTPAINLAEGVTELHVSEAARVADGPVVSWRADLALPAG